MEFELGAPFKPFEQLMAVFPAGSGDHIPTAFNELMTAEDSPILDFYPLDFKIDLNGKKHAWQGVALLPFIDEERLLKALAPRYPLLNGEEVARNSSGHDVLFSSGRHPSFEVICALYSGKTKKVSNHSFSLSLFHIKESNDLIFFFFFLVCSQKYCNQRGMV